MAYEPRTVSIRASSWSSLFDCPMKWEGIALLGMKSPSSPAAHLGTSIHAGTAVFDQARVDGKPIRPADGVGVVVDALKHPEYPVDWRGEQVLTPKTAERLAVALYSRYCTDIAPTHEYTAVELTCKPLQIDVGGGLIIELTGSLDRIRRKPSGNEGISDLKSGGCRVNADGEVSAKTDGPQLGQYELLAENTLGRPMTEPAEIIGLNTKGEARVGSIELLNCREMLTGTQDYPGLLHYAAQMIRSGSFHPNPRSSLCSPRYCPRWHTCKFHH